MAALPVYDESRGEFVDAPAVPVAKHAPPIARVGTPGAALTATAAGERRRGPEQLLPHLERIRRDLKIAGKAADAEILAELIELMGRSAPRQVEAGPDPDHQPIFAVCAAYVTALTAISVDEAAAAQLLARKLIGLGYGLPKHGGDTRGWKRLLIWRDHLERGRFPPELREIYDRAFRLVRHAPTDIDLKAVLDAAMAGEGQEPAAP